MKLKPLGRKILMRKLTEEETMTKTNALGIILPDSAKQDNNRVGIIITCGPDVENKDLTEGTQVLLSGLSMKDTGDEGQMLVNEGDIIAIIEE